MRMAVTGISASLLARFTVILSSSESSSIPRIAIISCNSLYFCRISCTLLCYFDNVLLQLCPASRIRECRIQRIYRRINIPALQFFWINTVVASKWANVVAGAGSVRSSAGTYTACTDVTEPFFVDAIRSCNSPISCCQCWLITYSRWHTAKQRGYL